MYTSADSWNLIAKNTDLIDSWLEKADEMLAKFKLAVIEWINDETSLVPGFEVPDHIFIPFPSGVVLDLKDPIIMVGNSLKTVIILGGGLFVITLAVATHVLPPLVTDLLFPQNLDFAFPGSEQQWFYRRIKGGVNDGKYPEEIPFGSPPPDYYSGPQRGYWYDMIGGGQTEQYKLSDMVLDTAVIAMVSIIVGFLLKMGLTRLVWRLVTKVFLPFWVIVSSYMRNQKIDDIFNEVNPGGGLRDEVSDIGTMVDTIDVTLEDLALIKDEIYVAEQEHTIREKLNYTRTLLDKVIEHLMDPVYYRRPKIDKPTYWTDET